MVKLANLAEISKQMLKECLLSVGLVTTADLQRVEDRLDDLLKMVEELQPKNANSATPTTAASPLNGAPPHLTDN